MPFSSRKGSTRGRSKGVSREHLGSTREHGEAAREQEGAAPPKKSQKRLQDIKYKYVHI